MKFGTYSRLQPQLKAHPRYEFWAQQNYLSLQTREHSNSDPERHEFQETQIIPHFGPENLQNRTQIDTNFEKMHSLTPAKMPTK